MKKIEKIVLERLPDYDSDLSYLGTFSDEKGKFAIAHEGGRNSYKYFNADNVENMKQARQNYERMMKYEKGELLDYGVRATAEIRTRDNGKTWLINKVSSGGLWGFSSDAEEYEFTSEEENQMEELRDVLKELGFTEEETKNAPIEKSED